MDVNDDEGCLNARGVLSFYASKLAPTAGAFKLPVFKPVFMRRARVSPSLFRR